MGQPPLGGCVLKQRITGKTLLESEPAAFRRLCVETPSREMKKFFEKPAAFRRLCVETRITDGLFAKRHLQPPLGGCVLKQKSLTSIMKNKRPAAFRRLCVETHGFSPFLFWLASSRL